PEEQIWAIRQTVLPMLKQQADCFANVVRPQLAEHGIHLLRWDQLTGPERDFATDYFRRNLFPVLTPLAVDPGHPFPFISNLSTSLGVMLRMPEAGGELPAKKTHPETNGQNPPTASHTPTHDTSHGDLQFARVKVPQ